MPNYTYQCEFCSHNWEEFLSISNMDIPLSNPCPECEEKDTILRICFSPPIGDPVRLGIIKPDSGVREILKKVQKNNPHHRMVKDR